METLENNPDFHTKQNWTQIDNKFLSIFMIPDFLYQIKYKPNNLLQH